MSVSTVSVVLILKKENEDVNFRLRTAFPSTLAAFREKILLKIKEDLPPGYTFTLKYKSNPSNQTFELCDDEDFETVLLEPATFEILVFPLAAPTDFDCKSLIFVFPILMKLTY
ncbi:hypothetical protein HK096_005740, partial [Nowakowskiella sp. JEL0078]